MVGGKKRKLETEAAAAAAAAAAAKKKDSSSEESSSEDESSSDEEEEKDTAVIRSSNKTAKTNPATSNSKPAANSAANSTASKSKSKTAVALSASAKTASQSTRSSTSSSSESETSSDEEEEEEEEEEKAPSPPSKKRKKAEGNSAVAADGKKSAATPNAKASSNKKSKEAEIPKAASSPVKQSVVSVQTAKSKKKKTGKDEDDASTPNHVVNGVATKDRTEQPQQPSEWTVETTRRLLSNISSSLPTKDILKYQTQQEKLDWKEIAFDGFDATRCKAKWTTILKSLRTFKTMSDLVGEAFQVFPENDSESESEEEAGEANSYPDPLWVQFFQSKCKELGGKKSSGKKVSYFKRLTEKFESMSMSEKEQVRQQQLEDMTAFISKLHTEKTSEEELEKKETKPVLQIKMPAKPHTPVNIFMNYAKDKVKNSEKSNQFTSQELTKRLRKQWDSFGESKKIKFVLLSIDSLQEYEEKVRKIKENHDRFLTDHIPDTVHVLTKSDLAVYESSLGIPRKPPKTGYSAFTQEKLSSGKYNEIEPAGRMAKIAQLWKELSDEDRTVWAIKTKSALEAFNQAVAGLPEETRKLLEALWKSSSSPSTAPSTSAPQDSKPPQKPFDAIRVFIEDKKEKFAKKNPELNASEINRRLTAKYNELDDEKKNKYKKKALAMKEEHLRERVSSASKPKEKKPPMNGYSLYSQECMRDTEMMKGVENKLRMGLISSKWKTLSDYERQSYNDRSKVFIEEFIAAHPDSEFAKKIAMQIAKGKKPSPSAAADPSEPSTAEPAAKLKNKMLDGLMPSATSTPKQALGKPKDEEEESDEDESEDESESESDSEDESSPATKASLPVATSKPAATASKAAAEPDESSSGEESSEEEEEEEEDEEEAEKSAKPDTNTANGSLAAIPPANQESSSEEDDSDEDD